MRKSIILGLDIGTTNVKAIAYLENLKPLAEASHSYPTYYPHPGWAEQNPTDWFEAIKAVLKEIVYDLGDSAHQITAMGLSAHAPGFIPVDSHGAPLLELIPIWLDERSLEHGDRLLQQIGSEWVGLGMPFAAFPAKLKWFTETHPNLARQAQYAMGVKSYVLHWLTGRYATDPSSEPGNHERWKRVCGACDWSLDRLVPVMSEIEIHDYLRPELAQEFGFKKPIQVVIGLNDGASAALGSGAVNAGEGVLTLATNGVIFLVSEEPIASELTLEQAIFCWPYIDGRWIIGGQTKAGASSLQWLSELLQGDSSETFDYDQMLHECKDKPPGSNGVLFFPYLMGRGTPKDDPSAAGGVVGLTLQTDRGDLTRAVLEGVAFTLRDVLDTLTQNELEVNKLMITGGGAQSEIWRQIVADILHLPLNSSEGDSCLGAAILAGVGVDLFPSVELALCARRSERQVTHPNQKSVIVYEKIYSEYCRKRDVLLSSFRTQILET